jgi:hypothetical protein
VLNQARLATLLIDLLTPEEEEIDVFTVELSFDIGLLAQRLVTASGSLNMPTPRGCRSDISAPAGERRRPCVRRHKSRTMWARWYRAAAVPILSRPRCR